MSRSYTEPSLCIPRVFSSITWHKVKEVIEGSDLGVVDRVDMVNKTNDKGDRFKRVFVHFKRWSMSDEAQAVRQRIMDGEEVKIVYDEPWFWKVYKSYAPRPERRTTTTSRDNKHSSRSSRSKPKIVVEHDNERSVIALIHTLATLALMRDLLHAAIMTAMTAMPVMRMMFAS
jgi:hypothetical protein